MVKRIALKSAELAIASAMIALFVAGFEALTLWQISRDRS